MPLLGYSGGESDSFLDVAIKDEEISTIVSASRVPNRKNNAKYHDVDMTAWRARDNNDGDSSSMRSKETLSTTGGSLPRTQISCQASVYSECNSTRSPDTYHSRRSTGTTIDMNSIRSMHTHDTSQRSRKCRRDSRLGSLIGSSRRESINSTIHSERSVHDDSSNSEGANNPLQKYSRRESYYSGVNPVRSVDSGRSRYDDNSIYSERDFHNGGDRRCLIEKNNNTEEKSRVALLEEKLAEISLKSAEIQSQVDSQQLKHRHLHLEFEDHQAFLRKLQTENITLRQENEDIQNSKPQKMPWYETSTNLVSPTTLSNAFGLSSSKQTKTGHHDELESTIAPQTLSTKSYSYFWMASPNKIFGYNVYKEDKPKEIDKPKNITVTTKIPTSQISQRKTLEELAQQLDKQNEKQARKIKKRLKRRKKKFGLSQVTMGGQISTLNMDELDL